MGQNLRWGLSLSPTRETESYSVILTRVAHKNFWWGWEGGRGVGYLSLSDRWRVTDSIDSGSWLHRVWLPVTQT